MGPIVEPDGDGEEEPERWLNSQDIYITKQVFDDAMDSIARNGIALPPSVEYALIRPLPATSIINRAMGGDLSVPFTP